jgi:hypothetical protein
MGKGSLVLAGVVGLALLGTVGAADPAAKGRRFQIDLRLLQGDPLGSPEEGTAEVLTQPSLHLVENQEGRVFTGQRVKVDGKWLDVGRSFRAVAASAAGGKVRLRIRAQAAGVVEDPTTRQQAVRTEVERTTFTREAKLGETLRVRVGKRGKKETWVELRVRELKE